MQLEGGTKEALGKRISSHDMRPEGNQLVDDPTPTIYVPKVTSDMWKMLDLRVEWAPLAPSMLGPVVVSNEPTGVISKSKFVSIPLNFEVRQNRLQHCT